MPVKMFLFSDPDLLKAFIGARERGVKVKVMLNPARRSGDEENEASRTKLERAVIVADQTQLVIDPQKLAQTGYDESMASSVSARVQAASEIGGVNTTVAAVPAELAQAQYFLESTTLVAPEDGRIVNLQVRPGMMAGDNRIGVITSVICDDGRDLLASYFQESIKYVTAGQPVEVAMNLYRGQIFRGRVQNVWKANGDGQLLPSGNLPKFVPRPPTVPQDQFAVAIVFDPADEAEFAIGAEGKAAISTSGMTGSCAGWASARMRGSTGCIQCLFDLSRQEPTS